jgi:hypothetical protein
MRIKLPRTASLKDDTVARFEPTIFGSGTAKAMRPASEYVDDATRLLCFSIDRFPLKIGHGSTAAAFNEHCQMVYFQTKKSQFGKIL